MKTLYFNGNIYTGDGFTHSLLVENGVILAVGDAAAMRANGANAFDLEGKTVIPGLNDSHMHLYGVGTNIMSVQMLGSKSPEDVIERGRKFIETNNVPEGTYVTGRGWNQDYFEGEKRLLNRYDLDKISAKHPIVFRRACGHMLVCNSLALELSGVNKDTEACPGGAIDKDANGEPTGIFREHAMGMIEQFIPAKTVDEMAEIIAKAQEYAASYGITSIQTNDINDGNFMLMDAAYKKVVENGKAKCRVTQQSCFNTLVGFKEYLEAGFRMGNGNSPYRIGPLKLFVDGSLGARTALMREPYADDPSTQGIECMSQETLDEFVRIATEHKMQVITHAIGDKAIEMVLDAIEKEGGENNELRHGVVHAQITDKPLLERFRKLNALCYAQPIFLHYDMHVVADRVGEELANTSYNFKSLYDMGVRTSFGTDSPVEDLKTFDNIHCAVNRQDLKHYPENGWVPSECFTVKEAIDCYTKEGAYASFEEYEKGTLEDGKFADFVVLDRNIFEIDKADLINTKVLMTVMGGEITYKA